MTRKVSVSVSLAPSQAEWLDSREQSNSAVVRGMIEARRDSDE